MQLWAHKDLAGADDNASDMAALDVDFALESTGDDIIPDKAEVMFYNSFASRTDSSSAFETVTCRVTYH